jgi:hypothetical protein
MIPVGLASYLSIVYFDKYPSQSELPIFLTEVFIDTTEFCPDLNLEI